MKEKENVLLEINKAKQITIEMNEKLENFYQNEKEKEKNNNEFIKNTNIALKEILNKLNVIDLNNQKKMLSSNDNIKEISKKEDKIENNNQNANNVKNETV